MKMNGLPVNLNSYESSEILTNKHFVKYRNAELERFYLPDSMKPFTDQTPVEKNEFIVDDNRGAVSPSPCVTMDSTEFYLSLKGIGSTTSPFSHQLLNKAEICNLIKDSSLRERIANAEESAPRYITSELWLRGSPYGGQGLEHAKTAMRVSEMADLTSINGFRIAPLVKIIFLPESVEREIKKLYWYRRFPGRIVQEARLVPSNIRIYFHSGSTIGGNAGSIFELFGIDSNEKASEFLRNFVKSGIAFLTLFTRSMKRNDDGTFSGLDFYDVWLDKDAVLAPDGTVYFVDLEGLEWITVTEASLGEKIDDQIYRSLYEFMYAYEQLERERAARFGNDVERKIQFELLLKEGLKQDKIAAVSRSGDGLDLIIGNVLQEEKLTRKFAIIDF